MKHCGTQEIESERLLLRKFEEDDADLMYKNWDNDTEVTQFLTWPAHENSDETRSLLKNWILSYEDPDTYRWCIVLKKTEEPIGSISVVSISPRAPKNPYFKDFFILFHPSFKYSYSILYIIAIKIAESLC